MQQQNDSILRKGGTHAEGVELFRYRIALPFFNDPDLDSLCKQIAELTESFCQTELAERAQLAWERSDDVQKRFHFPTLLYSLQMTALEQTDDDCSFQVSVALRHRGSATPLQAYTDTLRWNKEIEKLGEHGDAPPFLLKKKRSKRKQKKILRNLDPLYKIEE